MLSDLSGWMAFLCLNIGSVLVVLPQCLESYRALQSVHTWTASRVLAFIDVDTVEVGTRPSLKSAS